MGKIINVDFAGRNKKDATTVTLLINNGDEIKSYNSVFDPIFDSKEDEEMYDIVSKIIKELLKEGNKNGKNN